MPLENIARLFTDLGCETVVDGHSIMLSFEGDKTKKLKIDDQWAKEIAHFMRSKQYDYDPMTRKLVGPRSVEAMLVRISLGMYRVRTVHTFTSTNSRKVEVKQCSHQFMLHYAFSADYGEFFKKRVLNSIKKGHIYSFDDLFYRPFSATFSVPRKSEKTKILSEANLAIEGCLFKLAVEHGECWDFYSPVKPYPLYKEQVEENLNFNIPSAKYDPIMIKYFKVGVSSQFPSQKFLAYYHVLECNFLNVSDEVLLGRLKAHVHSTGFDGSDSKLQRLISIVKKHNDKSDETEMLQRVLLKYIDQDELIEFIAEFEGKLGEKLYTKSAEVFGESFNVQARKDHVIPNCAKLIKHVRNALVHSSDRYDRDDCHIPLTDSENIVKNYIPLIRYLAEKVVYARSS